MLTSQSLWQRSRRMILAVLLIVTLAALARWLPPVVKSAQATRLAFNAPSLPVRPTPLAPAPAGTIRFAVIGDYGGGGQPEADVAALVHSWNPDFIITVGDNNYPSGAASTIDPNIGQFYHDFIYPYTGNYGGGATENKFFPSLGNHDWLASNAQPYLNYFTLPNNERYYDFERGPVHFFAIDSDSQEPAGITAASPQALWLRDALAAAATPWKLVYFHHAPYSSGAHGSTLALQWPFADWGASAVLAGHDHTYERILQDGIPYFVDGLGGYTIYAFGSPIPGSIVRYNANFGAMLVEATTAQITFQFITRSGAVIDAYTLTAPATATPTITATSTATSTDTPTPAPTLTVTATSTPRPCCDLNGDGRQDVIDIEIVAAAWGTPDARYDFNHNGVVDADDIRIVAEAWSSQLPRP